jgi:hypothetical protein
MENVYNMATKTETAQQTNTKRVRNGGVKLADMLKGKTDAEVRAFMEQRSMVKDAKGKDAIVNVCQRDSATNDVVLDVSVEGKRIAIRANPYTMKAKVQTLVEE